MRKILCTHRQCGSALIEGLLSLIIFFIALIGLLSLLSAALVESGNARYRTEASLLASDLVGRMWSGDRSLVSLQTRFGNVTAGEYQQWLQRVQATLPGADLAGNSPQVAIDTDRNVTITLGWQAPGETTSHQLVVAARVTD
jgi:type IV pilus assembly protein PilV